MKVVTAVYVVIISSYVNCLVSHKQEEEDSKLIANQLFYDALQIIKADMVTCTWCESVRISS